MTAVPAKLYTLVGVDGKPYTSAEKGTLGGHRRTKIFGRLDCRAALRAIAVVATSVTGCSSPTAPLPPGRATDPARIACRTPTERGRTAVRGQPSDERPKPSRGSSQTAPLMRTARQGPATDVVD